MVAGIGEQRDHEVESALTALLARQLIRRVRHDRPEAEQEYAFQHALVRDVAYGQLPRGVRARKHAAIAEWLETRSSARAAVHADDAEIIAEHYAAALEFATASGDDDLARRLAEPAVRSLTAAGERAAILDAAAADHYFTRALGLVPEREPTRARLLESWGTVLHRLGRYAEASEVLAEAAEGLLALGDKRKAAWGMLWRASTLSEMCDERYGDLIRQACELLKDDGPSWERAWGLMASGLVFWGDGRPEEGVEVISQAIAMNAEAGVAEPVDNIGHRGAVRCESGDMGGLEDYARARELAEHQGLGPDLVLLTVNFANTILWTRGPQASLTEIQEGRDLAIRRGLEGHLRKLRALETEHLLLAGRWDDTLREAADLAPRLEEFDAVWDLVLVRAAQATCLARQGRASEAAEASAWLLRVGRHSRMTFIAACCLLASAEVAYGNGESDVAHDLLREFDAHPESAGFADKVAPRLPEMVRLALALDDRRLAERLGRRINTALPLDACASESLAAHLAEARGEHVVAAGRFADVASRWHDFGVPYEEGRALLGRGRCLTALRRVPEVAPVAQRAQEIFVCLAAEPALAEARRLLVPRVAAD